MDQSGVGTINDFKQEIERLNRELDQASSENIQSAQYGLVLLEEKKNLLQRCLELESLYENTKNELDITQEASTRSCVNIFKFCFISKGGYLLEIVLPGQQLIKRMFLLASILPPKFFEFSI